MRGRPTFRFGAERVGTTTAATAASSSPFIPSIIVVVFDVPAKFASAERRLFVDDNDNFLATVVAVLGVAEVVVVDVSAAIATLRGLPALRFRGGSSAPFPTGGGALATVVDDDDNVPISCC